MTCPFGEWIVRLSFCIGYYWLLDAYAVEGHAHVVSVIQLNVTKLCQEFVHLIYF